MRDGYGRMKKDGVTYKAHRLSWFVANKTIPVGHVIRHKCRNRNCVNPEHLETGTQAENCADRERDGTTARGERSGNAKLTEEQVLEIRNRVNYTQSELAEEFGVSDTLIGNIIRRESWKHV